MKGLVSQWGKEAKLAQYKHTQTEKGLVHEPINHNTVLVINSNCPLKYNWPANKALLWPRLAVRVKARAVWKLRNSPMGLLMKSKHLYKTRYDMINRYYCSSRQREETETQSS